MSAIDSETGGFLFSLGQILLQGSGFAVLYKYIPNCRVPAAHALIGGFTAALAGFVVKFGFEYYVTAGTLTNIYGAFVALPVLILWIYVAWFLFFAGAAVTATIPKLTAGRYMDSYRTGNDFLTALLILKLFAKRWTMSERPVIGLAELCDAADTYPESCDRVLSRLAHIGFVAPMAEDKHQSWVLTVDPGACRAAARFEEFCADPKVKPRERRARGGGESAGRLRAFGAVDGKYRAHNALKRRARGLRLFLKKVRDKPADLLNGFAAHVPDINRWQQVERLRFDFFREKFLRERHSRVLKPCLGFVDHQLRKGLCAGAGREVCDEFLRLVFHGLGFGGRYGLHLFGGVRFPERHVGHCVSVSRSEAEVLVRMHCAMASAY